MVRPTNDRINEVAELLEGALNGDDLAQGKIQKQVKSALGRTRDIEESHSTSDFPEAFRSVTERAFLGEYEQIESVYTQYTRSYPVNNLRPQSFYSLWMDGSNLPESNAGVKTIKEVPGGLPRIPELTEYPTFSFAASEQSFGVAKYGARVNFSFEMLLNDEWGVLETLPGQLAVLARNQEDIVATEAIASETGPNTDFFNNTNGNLVAGNPALSVDSLDAAISAINTRTFRGNPVRVQNLALVVPPALEREAKKITSIPSFIVTDSVNGEYTMANPVSNVRVIVNPWLPVIDKSANVNTTWYLLPYAGGGFRPSVVFSKIRGRETPELRIHNNTGNYLGGGEVPGREGSFLNDDIEFRVRDFYGAAGIASETVAVSLGTGV